MVFHERTARTHTHTFNKAADLVIPALVIGAGLFGYHAVFSLAASADSSRSSFSILNRRVSM